MPPPMPNPTKRMTANPARPVGRYRPGKAVHEDESSEEEDSEEEVQQKPQQKPQSRAQAHRPKAPVEEEDEDDDEEGFVTDEDDDNERRMTTSKNVAQREDTSTLAKPSPAQIKDSTPIPKQELESEKEEEEEDSDEEEDDSEDSSSEEQAPQRKFQRPTFIKKTDRKPSNTTPAPTNGDAPSSYNPLAAASTPEVDEQARRRVQAELLIKDKLEKDLLARAAGKKAWDDDDEVDPEATVDDTDGIDPKAEYLAWYLREVKRRKRDKEAIEEREREIEEKERRRNLSATEREKEDKEFVEKQKEERDQGRGKANYLAKYHHKGAFFQDDAMAEILKKRDIMGAKFADEVSDKSALPEYMRVRDMTKLGKKGRTRYKDLKNEDTGRFGDEVKRWRGAGDNGGRTGGFGGDLGGADERFMPDNDRDRGPTGANASAVGMRRERRERSRSRSRSRSPRRRRDDSTGRGDSYRPRRRSYSRSRSRSRTPPRRKRSHSPDHNRDKRVRVEAT